MTYPTGTIRDLLDAQSISWKYYAPRYKSNTVGVLWNAFAAIDAVKNGPEWATNISMPETNIFADVSAGNLPMVSWVIPNSQDSRPTPWTSHGTDDGPSWVAQVVNAIGTSSYWDSTAIVIVCGMSWGGFYDHVPPPFLDNAGGLGFRVPMIVVSPYVSRHGTVAHTQYGRGSANAILKFVEDTFQPRLARNDGRPRHLHRQSLQSQSNTDPVCAEFRIEALARILHAPTRGLSAPSILGIGPALAGARSLVWVAQAGASWHSGAWRGVS